MVQPNISLPQFSPTLTPDAEHGGCGSCGKGADGEKCGNGLEKIYPTTAVRFGYMRYIGEFTHAPNLKFTCGSKVVVQTKRGLEIGSQVSLTCSGCDKSVTRDQMKEWVDACGDDAYVFDAGRILREATSADLAEYARIQEGCAEKRQTFDRFAVRHKLGIKVVDCECMFGGERIIYYFTSAERVDFRAMVKDLAKEYRTRIEMRQVGARDEARLLADYETCGREVCCKVFLKTLRPISMRMAKVQKATLDPTQVSGRCGRLKCCLRYEHESYEELDKKLPKRGVRVRTAHGEGVVEARQILTQLIRIRKDDGELVTVVIEDVLETGIKPAPKKPDSAKSSAESRGGDRSRPGKRQGRTSNRRGKEGGQSLSDGKDASTRPTDNSGSSDASNESKPDQAPGESGGQRRPRRRRRRRRGSGGDAGSGPPGNA